MDLFLHCTSIQLGNGAESHFWKDSWHNGETLAGLRSQEGKIALSKLLCKLDAG
jgi:hypothetical protein